MARGFVMEFLELIRYRKRYWMVPILLALGALSLLIVFTEGSAVAPFIYALF